MNYRAKKSIKCRVLQAQLEENIGAIWGKNDFLGIFGVKTHGIIEKKKLCSTQPPSPPTPQKKKEKVNIFLKLRRYIEQFFDFFFLPNNLKNTLDYRSKKSKKYPLL